MKKKTRGKISSTRKLGQHADEILKELAANSRDFAKQGMRSVTLPRAELIRKLSGKTAHSPFLTQIGWGNAVRGQMFGLRFVIMNPDPYPWDEANLGLSVYWGPGTGLVEPGDSVLNADPALGVLAIELGTLNPSATPYNISAAHALPATLAPNSTRSEVSYLLYTMNSFGPGVLLERGSLSVALS
jgi:hypothetical protein